LLEADIERIELPADVDRESLAGRSMLVRKTRVVPIECVVRGYLSGSGWREYVRQGTVCGVRLPPGLRESDRLAEPIFTPATKADSGHDENISFDRMVAAVGGDVADELRRRSLEIYRRGAEFALARGIIIADTKFEWGHVVEPGADQGKLILIDEALTPDSARFWPADCFEPGRGQPSFDKQFVRDWLETTSWDKQSPPPALPDDVVVRTREKYIEAYEILTGARFAWR
jgi:phosphoribosylaminoimidazole-succinocarboxamide synthase